MKPDQQSNYWQHDPETDAPADPLQEPVAQPPIVPVVPAAETYTPQPGELISPPSPETPASSPEVAPAPENPNDVPVRWSAIEYIHHQKDSRWFAVFGLVVIGFIALDLFVLKSYTFSVLVIVMAIAIIIYSRRPPRTIGYTLSPIHGLYIEDKLYPYSDFKSFGVIRDGEHHSIMLIPTKRFSPGVSVYFPEESGESIVDVLGARLPMEALKLDVIDTVVRILRL